MKGAQYFTAISIECCGIETESMDTKIIYASIDTGHEYIDIRNNDTQITCHGINTTKIAKESKTVDARETDFDVIEIGYESMFKEKEIKNTS